MDKIGQMQKKNQYVSCRGYVAINRGSVRSTGSEPNGLALRSTASSSCMIAHFLPCPKRPAEWAWQKGKRPMPESSPKSNCPSSIKCNGKVQSVWTSAENEIGVVDSSMNCLRTHMYQGDKPLLGLIWFEKQSHDDKNKNLRYAYCIMQFFSQKLEFKIK